MNGLNRLNAVEEIGEFGDTSEKKNSYENMKAIFRDRRIISMSNISEVRVLEMENEETDDGLYLKKE